MIEFINDDKGTPYKILKKNFKVALDNDQKNIDAMAVSSYCKSSNEVNSRFVNLKFVDKNKLIFFSNYNSIKAQEFQEHNTVSALLFWNTINLQIRIKAKIYKTSEKFSNNYFLSRSSRKNALAISSNQSHEIDTYETVIKKYKKVLNSANLSKRPNYWGGYELVPFIFEFWEGHSDRLNKREEYKLKSNKWHVRILEP